MRPLTHRLPLEPPMLVDGRQLRAELIAAGVINPERIPIRRLEGRATLRLDGWAHAEAARQIADFHANGPAWDMFTQGGNHARPDAKRLHGSPDGAPPTS